VKSLGAEEGMKNRRFLTKQKKFKTPLDSVFGYRVYNQINGSIEPEFQGEVLIMNRAFNYMQDTQTVGGGSSGKQLKIGEVSRLSGIGIEALRFYEKSGLLDRPGRTYSGYRLYDESVLERLAFIKQAQVLGFTLDEIRQLIQHKQKGENPCAEVREIVRTRLAELNERIEQMINYRDDLTAALAEWDETGEAEGHVCGLIEGAHIEHEINHKKVRNN
jgi:MerR family transcriptional regulator, copper efflux regulator